MQFISKHLWLPAFLLGWFLNLFFAGRIEAQPKTSTAANSAPEAKATNNPIWLYTYEIVSTLPHDRTAFTQGLIYRDGKLLESTGLKGESTLREVDLDSGKVLRKRSVAPEYFAEGLALLGDKLYQLTWQEHKVFVYNFETFQLEKELACESEGWGLTTDGHSLITSDGTSQIRFRDPATFTTQRTINVTAGGQPVSHLNELEFIKGEIFANIWTTDYVVRIDPTTGFVNGAIDFSGLLSPADRQPDTDVLNGIAYDAEHDRIFVTGKHWPKLFEVRLVRKH